MNGKVVNVSLRVLVSSSLVLGFVPAPAIAEVIERSSDEQRENDHSTEDASNQTGEELVGQTSNEVPDAQTEKTEPEALSNNDQINTQSKSDLSTGHLLAMSGLGKKSICKPIYLTADTTLLINLNTRYHLST